MNKRNLELLGLTDPATAEQIDEAYTALRTKLLEDRFLDGEAGNEAAKMLTKIETAHDELLSELAEMQESENLGSGDMFAKVEELIRAGNIDEAQRALDTFNERGAQWHYLQSVVFYRKNWINESKKQLEIAIKLDGENDKYKQAYKKLNDKIDYDSSRQKESTQSVYEGQDLNSSSFDDQMGGSFCASCAECCALNACINCMCNGCCR